MQFFFKYKKQNYTNDIFVWHIMDHHFAGLSYYLTQQSLA